MELVRLNGTWALQGGDGTASIAAPVPGDVHTALLAAGAFPDPYCRDNERGAQWIGETDWTFARAFEATPALQACPRVVLRCEGLDTIATVLLNGRPAGRADNMYRTWEFEVRRLLKAGTNTIAVRFAAPLPYVRRRARGQRPLPAWGVGSHKADSGAWIRKQPSNFGWDWGPALVTCGIWRDIELVGIDTARLADLQVRQSHARRRVRLDVAFAVERAGGGGKLTAQVSVAHAGAVVASGAAPVRGRGGRLALDVPDPRLWWPNGMGEQPLYEVTVDLLGPDGELADTDSRRVGLRRLELRRRADRWGESFEFTANGVPFFAKGANWIPADAVLGRLTAGDYARLIADAAAANMNILRVWGGGLYEHDVFYNLCDELGICVWQDFMFACSTYPTFDAGWMATVAAEAADNVRRLRHHPCIALWCGNNELEQGLVGKEWTQWCMSWEDYGKLFDVLLPRVVRRLDPDRPYWPCSPHSPRGDRADHSNPACGDAHLWQVWHGGKPLEWYRGSGHRFCSEFGFQSFPEPRTVAEFTVPADRNVTAPVMEWHQRCTGGNAKIMTYMLAHFRMPCSFEMTLWLSQILQARFIEYAVRHWRRARPRTMGAIYWQLNDCWPVASWASIDYHGRWKALHYAARRFYAPLLVSGIEDAAKGTVDVHVGNDLRARFEGRLRWTLTTVQGEQVVADSFAVSCPAGASRRVKRLDLAEVVRELGADDLLVWLELERNGKALSRDVAAFAPPKRFDLPDPRIRARVTAAADGGFLATLTAARPALWTWLALDGADASWSDNFLHLRPGVEVQVAFEPWEPMSLAEARRRLRVRSLVDTYREDGA